MTEMALRAQNEAARLEAVRRYGVLDTPPDAAFDCITALAARRFGMPISIISIVDEDRVWFKSHHGLDVTQIGTELGLCSSAILSDEPWILEDARKDARALANPLVSGPFGLQFYAGVALKTYDGFNLGTLCVIDLEPHTVRAEQIADLKDLASLAMEQLELRRDARIAAERAEVLKREVDHRVMNSLQFVCNMLQMQENANAIPEVREQLQAAAGRVLAVARLHQHFHLEGATERMCCLAYLKRICADLEGVLGTAIEVEGIEALIPSHQAQPIGLVVNELVTNAAKHGGGNITVRFEPAANTTYAVTVTDDGDGLPADFDPSHKSQGLGMRLVSTLARQLGGEISACTNPSGRGACFVISFPAT